MSSYFDRVEQGMCEVVERHAHRPWYVRILLVGRGRTVAVVLAALAVAAPAVGAVTNWFGFGAPDRFPSQSATLNAGRALPATSELLPLRVPDPQGGPPWGVRLVHTTRGDTCIQLGRVEDGTLGSLGIDYAWNNDHLFHPFPDASEGDDCGTTDAAGHGFLNVAYTGVAASANPTAGAKGVQANYCRPVGVGPPARVLAQLPPRVLRAIRESEKRNSRIPVCRPGSTRMIFVGLLGPDATSITYQAPDGSLETQKTSGEDGAYLLVFASDAATCKLYTQSQLRSVGCGGGELQGNASPSTPGAVRAITYRDGHTCNVDPPQALVTAERAVIKRMVKLPGGYRGPAAIKLFDAFLAKHHLGPGWERRYIEGCPAVGYVAPREKRITSAMVATPINVKMLPREYGEITVDITFIARQAVKRSSSWYEDYFTNPPGCSSSGQGGEVGFGNIRAGQIIHDKRLLGSCDGVYHGLIGYMQNSGPIDQNSSGGGTPGQDGSVVVGRFSFTIH